MTAVAQPNDLRPNAIGLPEVLFQSITHMAPGAAVAFSILVATIYAGGSTPLSVVIALVACMFVAVSIGQLAKHLPSAGGLYTYNAHGLGTGVGFLVAWAFMLAEPLVAPLSFLVFGNVVSGTLNSYWGTPTWLWAPACVLAAAGVWFITYRGIKISTETALILGSFEIVVFFAIAVTLIISAGGRNTLDVFSPNNNNAHGLGSVFPGMIYAILAFGGFESAAPLGEEARNPGKTIPRAVILSCLLIGLFYVFCYYAATVYFGPDKMASGFFGSNNGDPWTGMAKDVWGIGWILVFLAILNSAFANGIAGANAATRVGFSLGRIRALPAIMSAIHPEHRSPTTAVHAQFILSVVLMLYLGFVTGGPLQAFSLLGTIITICFMAIYILTNLSSLSYYWRERHDEFNWLIHFVIPIVGSLIFVPALIASFGIDFLSLGIGALVAPSNLAPIVIVVWMLVGVALLVYFSRRHPERIAQTTGTYTETA
jgi:amino acid transporter